MVLSYLTKLVLASASIVDFDHPSLRFVCQFLLYRLLYTSTHLFIHGYLSSVAKVLVWKWVYYLIFVDAFAAGCLYIFTATHKLVQFLAISTAPGDLIRNPAWFILTPILCVIPVCAFQMSQNLDPFIGLIITKGLGNKLSLLAVSFYIASQRYPPAMALCHYLCLTPVASSASLIVEFLITKIQKTVLYLRNGLVHSFLQTETPPDVSEYTYSPLQMREIRLLWLRRSGSNAIECELEHVSLDRQNLNYHAISYRWGSSEKPCSILVNGKYIAITRNAYSVLATLCPLWGTRWVWIDSICMDQTNTTEKPDQLRLMGEIYERAAQVHVHIGTSPNSTKASNFTHRLAIHSIEWTNLVAPGSGSRHRPFRGDLAGWDAVKELLDSEYWSRVWMIQEVSLAKRVKIVYGDSTVSWWCLETVKTALPWWKGVPGMSADTELPAKVPLGSSTMYKCREEYSNRKAAGGSFPSLPALLYNFRLFQASEAPDKFNCLLGLVSEEDKNLIIGAGRQDLVGLCTLAVTHALSRGDFVLFSMAGLHQPGRSRGFPSWVPDIAHAPVHCHGEWYDRGYHAGAARMPSYEVLPLPQIQTIMLKVEGSLIDSIEFVVPKDLSEQAGDIFKAGQFPTGGTMEEMRIVQAEVNMLLVIREMWMSYQRFGLHHTVYDDQDEHEIPRAVITEEDFWRTIITDYDGNSYPADPRFAEGYQIFTEDLPRFFKAVEQSDLRALSRETHLFSASPAGPPLWMRFMTRFLASIIGGQFGVTKRGYIGLFPLGTAPGDSVCVLDSAPVPFVLRWAPRAGYDLRKLISLDLCDAYVFCGDTYVHGCMKERYWERKEFKIL